MYSKVEFILYSNYDTTKTNAEITALAAAIYTDLYDCDMSATKNLGSTDYFGNEPKTFDFELDYDAWIETNIISEAYDISREFSKYIIRIYDGINFVFSGVLFLQYFTHQYSKNKIKFKAYDWLILLNKVKSFELDFIGANPSSTNTLIEYTNPKTLLPVEGINTFEELKNIDNMLDFLISYCHLLFWDTEKPIELVKNYNNNITEANGNFCIGVVGCAVYGRAYCFTENPDNVKPYNKYYNPLPPFNLIYPPISDQALNNNCQLYSSTVQEYFSYPLNPPLTSAHGSGFLENSAGVTYFIFWGINGKGYGNPMGSACAFIIPLFGLIVGSPLFVEYTYMGQGQSMDYITEFKSYMLAQYELNISTTPESPSAPTVFSTWSSNLSANSFTNSNGDFYEKLNAYYKPAIGIVENLEMNETVDTETQFILYCNPSNSIDSLPLKNTSKILISDLLYTITVAKNISFIVKPEFPDKIYVENKYNESITDFVTISDDDIIDDLNFTRVSKQYFDVNNFSSCLNVASAVQFVATIQDFYNKFFTQINTKASFTISNLFNNYDLSMSDKLLILDKSQVINSIKKDTDIFTKIETMNYLRYKLTAKDSTGTYNIMLTTDGFAITVKSF